ncbi:hypothetical protein BU24DRAFT_412097 [Aaosphaeria arxii CBS 175.79]|uniref:Subtelomeric hrmA-associated cluster protein AFUB-079030/YDR124W-like helical bundle domain-containing protein n=1 Tax=Aaosphaeria arxii CBS 175.79 TaxID=1450172 RepID=A0A6A5XHQ2_9PLEO|nr:uncharacterized protein BU24DRAFT_412097 [Aaosphaeria arxii CBS 175.79]KAF2012768.1 hypothetical protein BU24DRAFT_412097 [Aaosphaeria arxii CBS 175.79]
MARGPGAAAASMVASGQQQQHQQPVPPPTTGAQRPHHHHHRFGRGEGGLKALRRANPFVLTEEETGGQELINPSPCTQEDDQEVEGIPVGRVLNVRGKLVLQSLKGFEHLDFNNVVSEQNKPQADLPVKPEPARDVNAKVLGPEAYAPSKIQELSKAHDDNAEPPKSKSRKKSSAKPRAQRKQAVKRTRSIAQLNECEDKEKIVKTVPTQTFYIADIDALRFFYETRLSELTLKPIRKILTEWVAIVTPKRRKYYGKYSKKCFPSQLPKGHCPPWWPDDVHYEEPSHLESAPLKKLGAQIMLLHRFTSPETGEPRNNWIRDLRRTAEYSVNVTPLGDFTSSSMTDTKGFSRYNADMKTRALNIIIPDLFDTAQSFEDHVAFYDLYDGKTNEDPDSLRGKQHTWASIPRPERTITFKPTAEKKRLRIAERDSASAETVEDPEMNMARRGSTSGTKSRRSSRASPSPPPVRRASMPRPRIVPDAEPEPPVQRHSTVPLPIAQQQLVAGLAPLSLSTTVAAHPAIMPPQPTFQSSEIPVTQAYHGLPVSYVPYPEPSMNELQSYQSYVRNGNGMGYVMPRWPTADQCYPPTPNFHPQQMPQFFSTLPHNSTHGLSSSGPPCTNTYTDMSSQNYMGPIFNSAMPISNMDLPVPSPMDCKMSFGSTMSFDSNPAEDMARPMEEQRGPFLPLNRHGQQQLQ